MTACPGPSELGDYLAGRPDRPTLAALTDHIEACAACQDQLEALTARPALVLPETLVVTRPADAAGTLLADRYRLRVREASGANDIWLASDRAPGGGLVSVTVVAAGSDGGERLARFEADREVLTALDHPHVARPLDAGATPDGRAYFVREHVKGVPVAEHCAGPLPLRARLELFASVCEAVGSAHRKGVAHRGIKAAAVLVVTTARGPVPKVIDFGTAARDGDARDDVYALGALLSKLLVGVPLSNADRAALDRIVTAALGGDPGYETADALASAVRRFLADDARRPTPRAAVRRTHRWVFVSLILAAIAVGVLVWALRP